MITKYIKSFFYIMLLLISPLSCGEFNYPNGEITIAKDISIKDGCFYLGGKEYKLDDSHIDYNALAQHYPDITTNLNDSEYKPLLLQHFINDFYGSQFKVADVAFCQTSDGRDIVEVTISPQLFMKNKAREVVRAPFGSHPISLTSAGVSMISSNGTAFTPNTNIMTVKITKTMNRYDPRVLKYILCTLPHVQQLIISNLCKSFIGKIQAFVVALSSDQDGIQKQESDMQTLIPQADKELFTEEAQVLIDRLHAILEDIQSMELSVEKFIEKNQGLLADDSKKLTEKEIQALRESEPKSNIHDVLNTIKDTNIYNKLFPLDECSDFIQSFERYTMTGCPHDWPDLSARLDTNNLRPIERLFIQAFTIYVNRFEGGLIKKHRELTDAIQTALNAFLHRT